MKSSTIGQLVVLIAAAVLSLSVYAMSEKSLSEIEERIKPAGSVCLEGDDSCGGAATVAAGGSAAKSPADIYNSSCSACHSTGAAGAPKLGDAGAWGPRVAQGIDVVYEHAINGFNGMPPRGLCSSCSDDDLKATVDYMIENSQ